MRKQELDERESQELRRGEKMGFYIMFSMAVLVILVQLLIFQTGIREVFGETLILLVGGGVYLGVSMKQGIWKCRGGNLNIWQNLIYSLVFSNLFCNLYVIVISKKEVHGKVGMLAGLFFVGIFVLAFAVLTILGYLTEKVRKKRESKYADE